MNVIVVRVPVIITGETEMGWVSTSSLQAGDKVRFFTEQNPNGKPKPNGRPQLRITTHGKLGDLEPTPVELTGLIDRDLYEELSPKLSGAVELVVTAILKMDIDEFDRVASGAKSWVAGALIGQIFKVEVEPIPTTSANLIRARRRRLDVATSID